MHNYSFIDFRNEIRLKPFCIIIHLNCINIHLFGFHYGNHLLIIGFYYGICLWHFILSSIIYARIGTKITAPFNGVVQFILNNRSKFGRASDRECEAD